MIRLWAALAAVAVMFVAIIAAVVAAARADAHAVLVAGAVALVAGAAGWLITEEL